MADDLSETPPDTVTSEEAIKAPNTVEEIVVSPMAPVSDEPVDPSLSLQAGQPGTEESTPMTPLDPDLNTNLANTQDSLRANNSAAERSMSGENEVYNDTRSLLVDDSLDTHDSDDNINPCGFKLNSSLIRKTYIFKETSKNERTGRQLQFIDEVTHVHII